MNEEQAERIAKALESIGLSLFLLETYAAVRTVEHFDDTPGRSEIAKEIADLRVRTGRLRQ